MILDNELIEIFKKIISENKTEKEWAKIESPDMFQTEHYVGGYDTVENAFCFSFYDEKNQEYWFQISLKDIKCALKSGDYNLRLRLAE